MDASCAVLLAQLKDSPWPPSYRELMLATGFRSLSRVGRHLAHLEAAGEIELRQGGTRKIRVHTGPRVTRGILR